jgi:hypothetical protein
LHFGQPAKVDLPTGIRICAKLVAERHQVAVGNGGQAVIPVHGDEVIGVGVGVVDEEREGVPADTFNVVELDQWDLLAELILREA